MNCSDDLGCALVSVVSNEFILKNCFNVKFDNKIYFKNTDIFVDDYRYKGSLCLSKVNSLLSYPNDKSTCAKSIKKISSDILTILSEISTDIYSFPINQPDATFSIGCYSNRCLF